MSNKESITREVLTHLGTHFKKNMSDLRSIILDFPEANKSLVYPTLSLFSQEPEYTPAMVPYVHDRTLISGAKYKYRYVVGSYDWKIQADLWCGSKAERHDIYDKFFKAFNNQFPTMGLTLTMSDYFGILCRYDMVGFNYGDDGEVSSQTKEWRVKIDLIGHCKAILETSEAAIEQTVIDVSNVNEEVIIEE